MDTGNGRFEQFNAAELERLAEKHPNAGGVFKTGETLWIRGSKFKVKQVNPFGIRLKLLKRGTGGDRCVCPSCGQSHDPGLKPGGSGAGGE